METILKLYTYKETDTKWLWDDGSVMSWDNGSKTIVLNPFDYDGNNRRWLWDDGSIINWDSGSRAIISYGVESYGFPQIYDPVVITDFTFSAKRMGAAPTISASFYYHRCLDKDWTYNVFTVFNGERYFIKQIPTSGIANTDGRYQHSIELVSERILLDNVYFYDVVNSEADSDKPVSNNSKFEFFGDINEFVSRLNKSLQYRSIGYSVVIDDGVHSNSVMVSFENKVISEVLQEIYNTYQLPYYFDGKIIHVGYTNNAITHTFKYGSDEALLSINKENANYKVVTAISGSGSEDNIPYYYPNDYESKAETEANGGTWINPSTTLQPPIYRESLGKERFYKAQDYAYTIPGTSETYKFDNVYVEGKPKEYILDLSDIKPTITGIKNALGYGIDTFLDFAYDQDDNDDVDEEGNYVHPYFFAKLRKFDGANGFNLFDHAIDEAQMTISMTSGSCGACEWIIGVGEDTQKNLVQVDSDGNLLRDENGNVRCGRDGMPNEEPQDRQNDTSKYEVWIALKKDNSTFGEIMPNANRNYKPSVTDTFVILHIDLPKAYVLAAEERLKDALIAYMADNNSEKFNFSISFSRIFFAENPEILAQLNENARVQLEYNGDYIELYVSSFSYTMSKDVPLPEIKVELSDTLTISQNAIQTMINDLKGSGFGLGSGTSGDILKLGLAYFLRKDTNDRTRGKLSTDVGFEVGRFVSGASGAIMYIDKQTGRTVAELDKLYVRVKAYFETLEIVNVNSVGGKIIVSPAGSVKCINVVESEDATYYRCYFLADQDGEKIENRFHVGDQVYSQMFNAKPGVSNKVSNHFWWRLCVGVGEDYIDLSVADSDVDSDVPAIGDVMCQRGNRDDADRQNFIEISSVDSFSPNMTLFQGVNSYSLVGKDVISYGVDKTTNQAFMNLYGNMYIGDREGNSYMRYTIENGLELKGRLHIGTTFGDSTLEDAIKKASTTYKEDLDAYKQAMETTVNDLQGQIDGAIESWFFDPAPTLNNRPASEWDTTEKKNIHLGDLYYSKEGRAYRFQLNSLSNTYEWKEIVDTDIVKALENAKKAQDTADSKRKTFVRQPTASDSYDIGDIWLNATYDDGTTKYDNDMLRAITAKAKGVVFSIDHWTLASKYTDDTVAKEALQSAKDANKAANDLQKSVTDFKDYVDGAFSDGIITHSEYIGIRQYINQIETVKKQVTESYTQVYNNSLLAETAKTNLESGYNAFIAAATILIDTINNAIDDYKATAEERSAVDDKYTIFNTKYGDYTSYLNAAIRYIEEKLDSNIRGYQYLKDALTQVTTTEGGLILTSAVVLGYTDENKNRITMSGINGLFVTTKGTKTPAFWVGGDMVDIFDYYNSSTGKFDVPAGVRPAMGMDRMDGTGYRANGAFWWDSDGMIHADPLSFFVGENTVGALLASFQVVFKADNKSPDYLIPKVPFQSLNIATTLNLGKYLLNPATDALKLTRSDGANANFTTTGDIVAYSAGNYDLVSPIASASAIGMIKVGNGLSISADGTLSATGAGSIGSVVVDGTGNAITTASASGTTLTLTKGNSFLPLSGGTLTGALTATKFTSNVATGTSPVSVTSTTLCTNLNADLLDGYNANGLFTSLTNSGNNISVGIGGTTKTLTVGYASNADQLDGYHASSLESYKLTVIDASGLDNDTWYPVTMEIGNSLQTRIRIEGNTAANATWNSRSDKNMALILDYTVNGSSWGWTSLYRVVNAYQEGAGCNKCLRGLGQLTNSSTEYVYVRGGAKYNFYVSRFITPVLRTSTFTASNQSVAPTTTEPAAIVRNAALVSDNVATATTLQTARTINGTSFNGSANITTANWGTARNISISDATTTNTGTAVSVNGSEAVTLKLPATIKASLTGNATTATTLATSRLIWGQSFNGSADVKGDLKNVGSITASGIIQTTSDVVAYAAGDYDIILPVASADALGAIKIGSGLSIASDGTLNATATGGGQWGQITGTLSNQLDLQTALNGKSNTDHTHTIYAKTVTVGTTAYTVSDNNVTIPAYPTTLKNPKALTISLNSTSQGDYDGSSAKSINITAASIGAAASTHTHSYLPLTGGTLTGALVLPAGNASNTDKGLRFPISGTNYTALRHNGTDALLLSGAQTGDTIYFRPNGTGTMDGQATLDTNGVLALSGQLTSSVVTGTAPISVSSTTLCTNLNADMLDGTHKSGLFTEFTNSNNKVYITVGGTQKSITVAYATSAGQLSTSHTFWGQTFNGTQDVSGNMTGVGSITMSGQLNVASKTGSWIYGKDNGAISLESTSSSTSTYFPLYRWKTYTGRVFNLGGLQSSDTGHTFGFYMFDKDRTENGTDAGFYMNAYGNMKGTGDLAMNGDVVAYSTGTAAAPFKYWYPSVSTDGVLSWTNSTSTTTPTAVNIKGATGAKGTSVSSVTQTTTSTEDGGTNVITCKLSDGTTTTFSIKNGSKGSKGDKGDKGDTGATGPQGPAGTGETNTFLGSKFFQWKGWQGLAMRNTENGVSYGFGIRESVLKVLYKGDTTSNPDKMTAIASISSTGQWTGSDERLKNMQSEVNDVLNFMDNIPVWRYDVKIDPLHKTTIGITTQSIQPYFPECVDKLDETYFALNYSSVGCIAFQGVKELHALVKSQQVKIEELENRIKEL